MNAKKESSFQIFSHTYIPSDTSIICFSDLEGNYDLVKKLLCQSKFIERLEKGEKVCISVLGDFIDRGEDRFKLVEFFCWLKNQPFFRDKLFLFAGTHELDHQQNFNKGKHSFFHSAVLAQVENSTLAYKDKKNLFSEYFPDSLEQISKDIIITQRYEGVASRIGLIDKNESLFDINKKEVANRILLYELIRDLFDLLPLSANAGGVSLLTHSGALDLEIIKTPADLIFSDFYSVINSFTRNSDGRFIYGNNSLFKSKQAICDLIYSEAMVSDSSKTKPNFFRDPNYKKRRNGECYPLLYPSNVLDSNLERLSFTFRLNGHQNDRREETGSNDEFQLDGEFAIAASTPWNKKDTRNLSGFHASSKL